MKTKTRTKTLALVEIAIVLCSLLLVALPTIVAEDDFVLGIYGNANEDDTIDMRDLTYVKLIFFGKRPETELADAKYDAEINPLDFVQIKRIILGKENELTLVDSADRIVTVKKPLERIVTHHTSAVEAMRSLGLEKDRLAGVSDYVIEDEVFFPEFKDHSSTGRWPLDVENAIVLNPDVVFLYASVFFHDEPTKKLEDAGVTVLRFDLYKTGDIYIDEIKKLGYIIDKREEADEFLEFYVKCINAIKEEVDEIPEAVKPRVYFEGHRYHTVGGGEGWDQNIVAAGGRNIFSDLSGYPEVDPEAVINRDPVIIVRLEHGGAGVGYKADDSTVLKEMWNEIMNRTELANTTAVKEGMVYTTCDDVYSGAQCFIGIAYTAKIFHPSLFEDMDPRAIHQEYLIRFQHLDYDLDEHHVFFYPEQGW